MSYKKKIALIGIGYWGKVHLKYLQKIKSIEITKIFYRKNKPNLNNSKLINILTNNLTEIKKSSIINYIDIVTPIKTHSKIVIELAKENRNILVEKPLIMSKTEETIISKLIKSNNRIIVSYPYLYSKTLMFAKKQTESNVLGKLLYIEVSIQQCGRFLEYSVNELLGPHALSIISIFYDINNIIFEKKNIIRRNNITETSIINCKKNNKTIASINLSLNFASKNSIKIIKFYMEKGTIISNLNTKGNSFESYKYSKIKSKPEIKKCKSKKFNENDNMKYVIKDFIFNKKIDKNNFNLTKKINKFLLSK